MNYYHRLPFMGAEWIENQELDGFRNSSPQPPFSSLNPHHPTALSIPAYNSVEHLHPLRIISSSLHTYGGGR